MIAVKYSGITLVAQRAIETKTTAPTRIISGGAPSGGGWNHRNMLTAAASNAIAGAMKEDRFSIRTRLKLCQPVSMRRNDGQGLQNCRSKGRSSGAVFCRHTQHAGVCCTHPIDCPSARIWGWIVRGVGACGALSSSILSCARNALLNWVCRSGSIDANDVSNRWFAAETMLPTSVVTVSNGAMT